jgi:prefoldin subunit 5
MTLRFQQQNLNLKRSFEGISNQYDQVTEQLESLTSQISELNLAREEDRAHSES